MGVFCGVQELSFRHHYDRRSSMRSTRDRMDEEFRRQRSQGPGAEVCQRSQKMPETVPIQPWEWPEKPWSRLHINHAAPILVEMVLIVVDAHSKWRERHIVSSTSATAAIDKLRSTFATHGLPQTIVSENGPAFASAEYLRCNGAENVFSPHYHPSSNGQTKRAVRLLFTSILFQFHSL